MHTINAFSLPKETSVQAKHHTAMPIKVSPKLAQAKQSAAHNKNAPVGKQSAGNSANVKNFITGFKGMADSATICPYFGGCQPPDMALATSPTMELQGVNTSFAIYSPTGKLLHGPVNAQV